MGVLGALLGGVLVAVAVAEPAGRSLLVPLGHPGRPRPLLVPFPGLPMDPRGPGAAALARGAGDARGAPPGDPNVPRNPGNSGQKARRAAATGQGNPGGLVVPGASPVPRRCHHHHPGVPGSEHFPSLPGRLLDGGRGRGHPRGHFGSLCPQPRPDLWPNFPNFRHPPARGRRLLRGHLGQGQRHHRGGLLGGSGHGAGRAAGHGPGRSRAGLGAGPGLAGPGPGPAGPQGPTRLSSSPWESGIWEFGS